MRSNIFPVIISFIFLICSCNNSPTGTSPESAFLLNVTVVFGIVLAVIIIFILVFVSFREKKPELPLSLQSYLASQGFAEIDPFDQNLKPVTEAMKITSHAIYVKRAYKKSNGTELICWIQKSSRSSGSPTNHIIASVPNSKKSGEWIVLSLPGVSGKAGNIIRKSFGWSLRSAGYWRVQPEHLGQLSGQFELYVGDNVPASPLNSELVGILSGSGNVVLTSTGSIVLIERISVMRNEPVEDDVRKLIRLSNQIKKCV